MTGLADRNHQSKRPLTGGSPYQINDGQAEIGAICAAGGRVVAFMADGRLLGVFRSEASALTAIREAAGDGCAG